MAELTVSEELAECIRGLAEEEGLTVEEYLVKAVRTVRLFQREWPPRDSTGNETEG